MHYRRFTTVFLVVLLIVIMFSSSHAVLNPKQNVIFKTSSNNTRFTLGQDFEFYKVEINSSRLWMDKTYTEGYYTRYCIYMVSPDDAEFTADSWFAEKTPLYDLEAELTIDSPASTDVNLGFHSPNLITARAEGVVTQTWFDENQTLLMTGNTDESSVITIICSVTETEIPEDGEEENEPPENQNVTITDMEGCGNWVFSNVKYYVFRAVFEDDNGYADLDVCSIAFTDELAWVNTSYNVQDETFTLDSGSEETNLKAGAVTALSAKMLQVDFEIYFTNKILDAQNVSIYMRCNDTSGELDDWEIKAENYFHIYNIGGKAEIETDGNAGRISGGDVFEVYANNGSSVETSIKFRGLQHVKLLPKISVEDPMELMGYVSFEFFVNYCTDEDDWITGWRLVLNHTTLYGGSGVLWYWYAQWYSQNTLVKNDTFATYWTETANASCQLWIDLWFNRENASSVWGGRVNAFFFPMVDSANPWLRWLTGSEWGAYEDEPKESMCFGELLDANNQTVYAQQIKMVEVGVRINFDAFPTEHTVQLANYNVFDLSFSPATEFRGIQTPVFDETKVPTMPQGGFLGAIVSAIQRLASYIGDALGPAMLGFWDLFVGFIDSIFAWLGYPNLFSSFMSWVASLWTWVTSSFGYLIEYLTSMFTFIFSFIGKLLNTLSNMIAQWVKIIQGIFTMISGGFGTGIHIFNELNLTVWITIIAIMYPVYLMMIWDEKGIDAVIGHVKLVIDVFTWIASIFITVIQLFIQVIGRIIESIPIVE